VTALAIDVLREVSEAGGTVRLEGDMLRLSAPEPLPDELRARLRQHKAEIVALLSAAEPANAAAPEDPLVQTIAGLPHEVADGVRAVLSADRARGIPPQRWPQVQRDAARLVEAGWAQQALALGWTTADLFGCDQRAPWYRLDRAGLVLLTGGREVIELTVGVAALRTSTGSVLRFRRRPPVRPPLALLWELLTPSQATGPPIPGMAAHRSEERMAATFLAGPRRHPDQDHPSEEDHGRIDSARATQ
jgi:TubC N-terminal docking domain